MIVLIIYQRTEPGEAWKLFSYKSTIEFWSLLNVFLMVSSNSTPPTSYWDEPPHAIIFPNLPLFPGNSQ